MDCEICGKKETSFVIKVEGATVTVCRGCAKHGKILYSLEEESGPNEWIGSREKIPLAFRDEEEIIDGYGKIIKQAREKKGLSLEELGKRIMEKANYLDHIEKEKMLPTVTVARKLEKELGVKLVEKSSIAYAEIKKSSGSNIALTLGDMVQPPKKKKK